METAPRRAFDATKGGRDVLLDMDLRRGPLRRNVRCAIREAIQDGRLATGTRLPSSRRLAADLRVSRGVVADTYDQLTAEGCLAMHPRQTPQVVGVGAAPPVADESARPPRPESFRMRTDLRPEDLGDLLEQPLVAVLATRRKDDTVMLSPVWFEWRDGGINIWVPTPEGGKVAHIRRDPRVTVVVANQEWPYKGFELRGKATVSGDDFYGVLGRTALRYDGPEAAERMVASYAPGVVIRVEPGVIRAWDYEDEA